MAIVEGAPFQCNMHDFTTSSLEEWNTHCFGNPEHTETGTTVCRQCGTGIVFENLPFHKIGADGSKNISLLCETCESQMMGQVKRSKVENV